MRLTLRLAAAVISLVAIATGLWQLANATDGLVIDRLRVGTIPVTVFRPASGPPAPVVVIAHGFAGSQQLMLPFAVTLARNGYIAVTFDFPGHGRNPEPLRGGITDDDARNRSLLGALDSVMRFARERAGGDGRMALLGHSMASDIVIRAGREHPKVGATVAVSAFSPAVTATSPRNLLIIVGNLEPSMLKDEASRIVGMADSGAIPEQRVTYGSLADGTARRLSFSGGVEHIGVLYSRQSLVEALNWIDGAFGRNPSGFIDHRGPWLGLLYLGLVALAWPLSRLLPSVAPEPRGAGLRWRPFLPLAVIPALLTPLILWKLPTDFLPILLGDYLAAHFAVYGLLTGIGLWLVRRPTPGSVGRRNGWYRLTIAVVGVAAYSIFAIGLPIDRFVTSFLPVPGRLALIAAVLAGALPYFIADEWLTRGTDAPRGAYALTKFCFLVSLMIAVGLDLPRLFFLIIIVPIMLLFFLIYGLFSFWAYRRTNDPLVGALANAAAFAWAIAVTFPVVSPH